MKYLILIIAVAAAAGLFWARQPVVPNDITEARAKEIAEKAFGDYCDGENLHQFQFVLKKQAAATDKRFAWAYHYVNDLESKKLVVSVGKKGDFGVEELPAEEAGQTEPAPGAVAAEAP